MKSRIANAFNGVELALSVIRHIADSADERTAVFVSGALRMFWQDSSMSVAASCRYWYKDNKCSGVKTLLFAGHV